MRSPRRPRARKASSLRARAFAEPAARRPRARHRRGRARACRRRGGDPARPRRGAGHAGRGLPRLCRRLPAAKPEEVVAKAFGASHASLVTHTRKLVRSSVPRARRTVAHGNSRRSRPSACARCCSRSRATCAWCCCGWRRACRRCAGSPRRTAPCPAPLARESHAGLRAAGQPARHLADQVGAGGPGVSLPAARRLQARSRDCSTRRASSASGRSRRSRRHLAEALRGAGPARRGAGPAQAPVQHLEEDAGQGPRPSRRCSTCARCA